MKGKQRILMSTYRLMAVEKKKLSAKRPSYEFFSVTLHANYKLFDNEEIIYRDLWVPNERGRLGGCCVGDENGRI